MSDDAYASARQSDGRFASGNPGRPPGARGRQSQRLVMAILKDFSEHQEEVLGRLRTHYLTAYAALASRLLPRHTEIGVADPADYSQEQIDLLVTRARAVLGSIEDGHGRLEDLERVVLHEPVIEVQPVKTVI